MARTRGARARIAPGIYRDLIGLAVQLMVRGRRIEKRFPSTTPLRDLKDWRDGQRLAGRASCTESRPGTLEADVRRYLATARSMPTYRQRAQDLEHWIAALGATTPRRSITAQQIDAVMSTWLTVPQDRGKHRRPGPLSAQTVKLRRTALLRLYHVLDGKGQPNPVRSTTTPRQPAPEARGVSLDVVRDLFAAMPDCASRARLQVLAFAGLPPAQLGALRPADVDLERAVVRVPARRKGRGAVGGVRPLTPQAVEAFRDLARLDGWGRFSAAALWTFFGRAWRKAQAIRKEESRPLLPAMKPYDLRHSFASWLYAETHDMETVARLLGHASTVTTRRYALGAASAVDTAAVTKLGAVMGAVNSVPRGVTSIRLVTGRSTRTA
jgi:integrase